MGMESNSSSSGNRPGSRPGSLLLLRRPRLMGMASEHNIPEFWRWSRKEARQGSSDPGIWTTEKQEGECREQRMKAFWEPDEQTVWWEGAGETEASSQPRAGGSAAELLWVVSRSKNTHYPGESHGWSQASLASAPTPREKHMLSCYSSRGRRQSPPNYCQ